MSHETVSAPANVWLQMIANNPGHSAWYIQRFRDMHDAGHDLHGEARFVDALVSRGAAVLDAGCGPGRVGGRLAALGHEVVGVDLDPELIAAAETDHPGPTWLVDDLSTFDLGARGVRDRFDVIVCAGNVMTFLDPATRRQVLERLAAHLAPGGRIAVGFGANRGYDFDDFVADAEAAGLRAGVRLATWDLRPLDATSEFMVTLLERA